jgi:hypothetical protein
MNRIDFYISNDELASMNFSSAFDSSNLLVKNIDSSLISTIRNSFDISNININSIFPSGVLYYDDSLIIFQKPPCKKNINYIAKLEADISKNDSYEEYEINIPWQIYFIKYETSNLAMDSSNEEYVYISSIHMFFKNTQLNSFEDSLFTAPIPNFYSNGALCPPRYAKVEDTLYPKDDNYINTLISNGYSSIWNSNYNADLTACVADYFFSINNHYIEKSNSIIGNKSFPSSFVSQKSYYCDMTHISKLFSIWSELSLQEVTSLQWANPSQYEMYTHEYSHLEENYLYDYYSDTTGYSFEDDEDIIDAEDMISNIDYADFLDFCNGDPRKKIKYASDIFQLVKEYKILNFNLVFSSLYRYFS